MSKAIILVGGTGSGKTTTVKQMLSKVNKGSLLIFDVNNEYRDYLPDSEKDTPFDPDMDNFLAKASKVRKAIILIEDATAFLSNRGRSDLLVKLMIAKRHTGNTLILLFHSMRSIPKYIMDYSTDIFILKTNDDPGYIKSEFKNELLLEAWQQVQEKVKTTPYYKQHFSLY